MTLRPMLIEQARRLAAQTGGSLLAVIVVDGDSFSITTWGKIRTECQGLRRWSDREGDDVAVSMAAGAALEKR